jgi:hypothetical protein
VACVVSGVGSDIQLPAGTYNVTAPYAFDAQGSSVLGQIIVQADLSVATQGLSTYFTRTGNIFTANTSPVTINFNGYKGVFAWTEVLAARPWAPTVTLLWGRRYKLQAYYTFGPGNDNSDYLSPGNQGIELNATGTQVTPDPGGAGRYFGPDPDNGPLYLKAKTTDVMVDFHGYKGVLSWNEVESIRGPVSTTTLLVGRRYALQAPYTNVMEGANSPNLTLPSKGVEVSLDGSTVSIAGSGVDRHAQMDGAKTIGLLVRPVKLVWNGYPGRLSWWELEEARGPELTSLLLVNRRHTLQATYTIGLNDTSPFISLPGRGAAVKLENDVATLETDAAGEGRSFTKDGMTLSANVTNVKVEFAGYKGTISWSDLVEMRGPRATTALLQGRRYGMQTRSAMNTFDGSNYVSPNLFGVSVVDGQNLTLDEATEAVFSLSDTTLTARVSRVQFDPGAYPGPVCINDLECASGPGPFATNLLVGHTYTLANGGSFTVAPGGTCMPMQVSLGGVQAALQCEPNQAACSDLMDCPAGTCEAQCQAGTCVLTAGPMDEADACGIKVCDPQTGNVKRVPRPDSAGVACSDGNACSTNDACDGAGHCIGGSPVVCAAGPTCNPNICNPATGQCEATVAAAGTPCTDDNACTHVETCDGSGHCGGGVPVVCDDKDDCTADSCNPDLGCVRTPLCSGDSPSLYPVFVKVVDGRGQPQAGVPVVAYSGTTAMGPSKATGDDGSVTFALPMGAYRFTAEAEGTSSSSGQDCQMGMCDEAVIELRIFPPSRCATDEACTASAGPARQLHVLATDVGGGNLYHAIRESNSSTFLTSFGDVLAQAGRPWLALDRETAIVDVAAQSRGNELLVMVLVRSMRICVPLDPNCSGEDPLGPRGPAEYSLWWTIRHPSLWTSFARVPLGETLSFRSISLSGVGRDYTTFCGSDADGSAWTAELQPFGGWSALRNVKEMAEHDPGFITRISCQHQIDGGSLAITALAGGRAYATYVDPGTSHAYPNDNDGFRIPLLDSPGFDDLSTRLGLPPGLDALDVIGIEKVGDLHLIAGTPGGARRHAWTHKPFTSSWATAASIDTILEDADSSTALATGAGHMQVLQATAAGQLVMATRTSASQTWTNRRVYGPEILGGHSFGLVAAAEEVLIPFSPVVALWDFEPDFLKFIWYDSDDFESEYRVTSYGSVVKTIHPVPSLPGDFTLATYELPRGELEPGRAYRFEMSAIGAGGESYRKEAGGPVGRLVTQAKPTLGDLQYWAKSGFLCFECVKSFHFLYGYQDTSVGRAELRGTRWVQLRGVNDIGQTWDSPLMTPGVPDGFYDMDYDTFIHQIGGDFTRWHFWFETVGFDGRRLASRSGVFSNFNLDGSVPGPPPPPPLTEVPEPTCCFERIPSFGED